MMTMNVFNWWRSIVSRHKTNKSKKKHLNSNDDLTSTFGVWRAFWRHRRDLSTVRRQLSNRNKYKFGNQMLIVSLPEHAKSVSEHWAVHREQWWIVSLLRFEAIVSKSFDLPIFVAHECRVRDNKPFSPSRNSNFPKTSYPVARQKVSQGWNVEQTFSRRM